ncbi:MAG: MFS transporter [Aureliella sp.]
MNSISNADKLDAGRAFDPLKIPTYRSFWIAGLVSNMGTWMHETGAQWQMALLDPSPEMVSAVRTAMTIPVFCLALPAGVWADRFDKRRWLLGTQSILLAIAVCMAVLAATGQLTPWPLLILTAAMGVGMILNQPAWQSLTPELVPPALIPSAVSVGSMSFNLARSLGPALAGYLIWQLGIWSTFLFNACSFLAVMVALLFWRPEMTSQGASAETVSDSDIRLAKVEPRKKDFWAEMLGGLRTVYQTQEVRHTLLRLFGFALNATILWSLLSLVAKNKLGFSELGFGFCLGIIGSGAVTGTLALPRIRLRFSSERIVLASQYIFGLLCILLGFTDSAIVILPSLFVIGCCWMATMTTFNATAQVYLPREYRARGMAAYMMAFALAMAIGSVGWGWLAKAFGLETAYCYAGVSLICFAGMLHSFKLGNLVERKT